MQTMFCRQIDDYSCYEIHFGSYCFFLLGFLFLTNICHAFSSGWTKVTIYLSIFFRVLSHMCLSLDQHHSLLYAFLCLLEDRIAAVIVGLFLLNFVFLFQIN